MNEERYKISEMAKLLGVTTHMLRHYEKMKIIRPEVDEINGYRYYSVVDTRRFNLGRTLLASGFSLEQSAQIMKDIVPEELKALARQKIEEKNKEILHAELAIKYLEELENYYPDIFGKVDQVWVEHYPNMWRLELSDKEEALGGHLLDRQKKAWLENLPAVKWVSRMRAADLQNFPEGKAKYTYGLMCPEKDAVKIGLEKTGDVEVIPGGDYLVTIHTKSSRGPYLWSDVSALINYLRREEIRTFGDAFSHIVASKNTEGGHINYHKVFLKIYS